MHPKNIIIIGGGTAGWLTALYLNKFCPNSKVTLVESTKIGILGAGEGSVPVFVEFLKKVGIDESEFVNRTNATYKLGVHFRDWKTSNTYYNHYFFEKKSYSFHFDARLVADFLKEKALSRGVHHIDANVYNFVKNKNGDIDGIVLESEEILYCDFLFNCMGMNNPLINRAFQLDWQPYTDYLTVNSALPYRLPMEKEMKYTDTKAIAMKYGWMWQIPLQNRWGCGYVFDDNYTNEVDAKTEIEEYLGYEITTNKLIKFKSGTYSSPWVHNVIFVGLSMGFIEPLEATSIMQGVIQLNALDDYFLNGLNRDGFNSKITEYSEEIMNFIYYHYLNNRNDSLFWKHYTYKNSPDRLKRIIDENGDVILKTTTELRSVFPNSNAYELGNWIVINDGIKLKNRLV